MRKALALFTLIVCLTSTAIAVELTNLAGSEWSGWWYLSNKPYGTVTSSFFEVDGKLSGKVVFTNATTFGGEPVSIKNIVVSENLIVFEAEGVGGTAKFTLNFKKNGRMLDGVLSYRGTDYPVEMKRTK